MLRDEIELYCEYCDAKYMLLLEESFEKKEIKCYACNKIYYWYHCPKCETGFTSKYANPMCIECHFGKGEVAYTGMTAPTFPHIVNNLDEKEEKSSNILQSLFCVSCPNCGRWHFPFEGMGKIPLMCDCGNSYTASKGKFFLYFFTSVLFLTYIHQKYIFIYKNDLYNILCCVFFIISNLVMAPRLITLKLIDEKN